MIRLAADENFNFDVVRGVRRRNAAVDVVGVQDAGLSGAADPAVLEWAAQTERILLTHDVATMTHHAYDRVRAGRHVPVGVAIDEVLILAECSVEGEWEGQVRYLPLK